MSRGNQLAALLAGSFRVIDVADSQPLFAPPVRSELDLAIPGWRLVTVDSYEANLGWPRLEINHLRSKDFGV